MEFNSLSFLSFGSEAFAFVVSIAASWWLRLGGKDVAKERSSDFAATSQFMTDASGWIFSENECYMNGFHLRLFWKIERTCGQEFGNM